MEMNVIYLRVVVVVKNISHRTHNLSVQFFYVSALSRFLFKNIKEFESQSTGELNDYLICHIRSIKFFLK